MKIQILHEAELDLLDGYNFYEMQSAGLGDYFIDSVFADVDSLQLFAGAHEIHFGYHRLLVRRFPLAVFYKIKGDLSKYGPYSTVGRTQQRLPITLPET